MALQKNIELANGVIANYHTIVGINKNYDLSRGYEYDLGIDSYIDQSAYQADKQPVARLNEKIPMADSLSEIYGLLKLNNTFIGASDI